MTTRGRARLILACVALAAGAARSEVRITSDRAGALALSVQPVFGGIWTPKRTSDGMTLNPTGDRTSDGPPVHLAGPGALVVSWMRPATGDVVIVLAGPRGAREELTLPGTAAVTTPWLGPLGQGALMVWQGAVDGAPHVFTAGVKMDGLAVHPVDAGAGTLLDVVTHDGQVLLTVADDANGSLELVKVVFSSPNLPIPVPITFQVAGLDVLPTTAATGERATPVWRSCLQPDNVLAWTQGDGRIGFVQLSADGIVGEAEQFDGPSAASCPAILNAVERHVASAESGR